MLPPQAESESIKNTWGELWSEMHWSSWDNCFLEEYPPHTLVLQPLTILVTLLGAFQFVDISPVPGEPNLAPLVLPVPLGTILFQIIPPATP